MLELVYSKARSTPDTQRNSSPSKPNPKNQKLKLVVSNPNPLSAQEMAGVKNSDFISSFCVKVHRVGSNLYQMTTEDASHHLECDLVLEVEEETEGEFESATVICHFPTIQSHSLKGLVEGNETLHSVMMIQFQVKILEQLLLFCATHYASKLIIFADDAQASDLEIYRNFLMSEDQTLTSSGEKTEMVIPADTETFDDWVDFMDQVNTQIQQALWREQKISPIIYQYLKAQSLSSF